MTTIKAMEKHAQQLRGQLGAEFKYLGDLKEELMKEGFDLSKKGAHEALKDIKKAERILRGSIGRTERRDYRFEHRMEEDWQELNENLPQRLKQALDTLTKEMSPLFRKTIKELSRKNGQIPIKAKVLEKKLKQAEKNPAIANEIIAGTKELIQEVALVTEWVQGLSGVIGNYGKFLEHLEKL